MSDDSYSANETACCFLHGQFYSGFPRCPVCAVTDEDSSDEAGVTVRLRFSGQIGPTLSPDVKIPGWNP